TPDVTTTIARAITDDLRMGRTESLRGRPLLLFLSTERGRARDVEPIPKREGERYREADDRVERALARSDEPRGAALDRVRPRLVERLTGPHVRVDLGGRERAEHHRRGLLPVQQAPVARDGDAGHDEVRPSRQPRQ